MNHAHVAYFSMEIMLRTHIPTYAGGLGMLAGDLLRSCADMEVPAVGMTLVYNGDHFVQKIDHDGNQSFTTYEWRKNDQFVKLPEEVTVNVRGEDVVISVWRFDIVGFNEFVVPVFLLDTEHTDNAPWMQKITQNLYGGGQDIRIAQELILGIGGVKMLQALGYSQIDFYHMNEGHAAFAPLAVLPEHDWNDQEVKKKFVFTTHTPIPEGHDQFPYDAAYQFAEPYLPWHIKQLATEDSLHMTHLALNTSHYSFGVSEKHGAVSRNMFPGKEIDSITNGVHHITWTASNIQDVFNDYLPGWQEDPDLMADAIEKLPDEELWNAHQHCKQILVDYVNKRLTSGDTEEEILNPDHDELFDTETLTIALARRPVEYKRPLLVYHDLNRLVRIAAGRVQIIQSGKSHPADHISQGIVREILHISKKLKGIVRIVYLENYSPKIARLLTSGCDVWLNTPRRPLEASGTSGMKAAMNGVLNFSVLDGWWIEGHRMVPEAGWSIGPNDESVHPSNDDTVDGEDLYHKLEHEIIPQYYHDREGWIKRMKHAITLGKQFSTHRCIREYQQKAWTTDSS